MTARLFYFSLFLCLLLSCGGNHSGKYNGWDDFQEPLQEFLPTHTGEIQELKNDLEAIRDSILQGPYEDDPGKALPRLLNFEVKYKEGRVNPDADAFLISFEFLQGKELPQDLLVFEGYGLGKVLEFLKPNPKRIAHEEDSGGRISMGEKSMVQEFISMRYILVLVDGLKLAPEIIDPGNGFQEKGTFSPGLYSAQVYLFDRKDNNSLIRIFNLLATNNDEVSILRSFKDTSRTSGNAWLEMDLSKQKRNALIDQLEAAGIELRGMKRFEKVPAKSPQ